MCRDASGLCAWRVAVGESRLWVRSRVPDRTGVMRLLGELRGTLAAFVRIYPPFAVALRPLAIPPEFTAPPIAHVMVEAAAAAGVGPMAGVAGAIAEHVCRFITRTQPEAIVENGGDIYIISGTERTCAVHAGDSPLSMRIGIALDAGCFPCAVCTSSATVGPSLSFGAADAAVVAAGGGALADALATALGNRIRTVEDLADAVSWAHAQPGVIGALAVLGDRLAVKGNLQIVHLA